MARPATYSYSDAGFNGFFRRTLVSSPNADSLNQSRGRPQQLNFDDMQLSGAFGDKVKFGRVIINAKDGRLEFEDENGVPHTWLGNIDG